MPMHGWHMAVASASAPITAMPQLTLTRLPNEVVLAFGDAIVAHQIADLVATARTCRKLHCILIDLAYRAALESDSKQILRSRYLPKLTLYSVLPPLPVVLWAAERNRVDTLELFWQAQCKAQAAAGIGRRSASIIATTNILASAFWYPMPQDCQHDLDHRRWGHGPWYEGVLDVEDATLLSGWSTALHLAARTGSIDAIRALVGYGARVDATARHVCICGSRHMQLTTYTERIIDPDDASVTTPLHVALANGQDTAARLLVELGADWSQAVIFHTRDPARLKIPSEEDDDTIWDNLNNHHSLQSTIHESSSTRGDGRPQREEAQAVATANVNSTQDHEHSGLDLGREWICNDSDKKLSSLGSSIGMSHGASGLRIAAANGMLPFLQWLKTRGSVLDSGEFHEFELDSDLWRGAFYYAAHADSSKEWDGYAWDWGCGNVTYRGEIGAGAESQINARRRAKELQEAEEEEEEGIVARTEELVECLLALGVQWDDAGSHPDSLIIYAQRWGSHVLANVLEERVAVRMKGLWDSFLGPSGIDG